MDRLHEQKAQREADASGAADEVLTKDDPAVDNVVVIDEHTPPQPEHFDPDHRHHHHHYEPSHADIAVAAYYIWLREASEPIIDSPELAVSNWLEAEQDLIADHEHDEEVMEIVNKHTEENG